MAEDKGVGLRSLGKGPLLDRAFARFRMLLVEGLLWLGISRCQIFVSLLES